MLFNLFNFYLILYKLTLLVKCYRIILKKYNPNYTKFLIFYKTDISFSKIIQIASRLNNLNYWLLRNPIYDNP